MTEGVDTKAPVLKAQHGGSFFNLEGGKTVVVDGPAGQRVVSLEEALKMQSGGTPRASLELRDKRQAELLAEALRKR